MPAERVVLIVDDEEVIRHALERLLKGEGYTVHVAHDGRDALRILESAPVQLVLSDFDMPGMNGVELFQQVRQRWPRILRVMLTGNRDVSTVVRSINEGEIYRFLHKPWENAQLKMMLHFAFETLELEEALSNERERSERLLLNVLPREIADRLKAGETTIADRYSDVSVLFGDLVGFTELSARLSPVRLVALLDEVFSEFDALAEARGLEKIKTIGDAYLVVAGIPVPRPDHAHAIADMALEMAETLRRVGGRIAEEDAGGTRLQMRLGVASGPVIAGVIGRRKFIYDLWGDTVNTASRMESHGEAGRVQITEETRALLGDAYRCEPRGGVHIKGKGPMSTYWLIGKS